MENNVCDGLEANGIYKGQQIKSEKGDKIMMTVDG